MNDEYKKEDATVDKASLEEPQVSLPVNAEFNLQKMSANTNATMLPYMKVDYTRACRVGDDFAISFFQMDYQVLVDELRNNPSSKIHIESIMPVAKIVMNKTNFGQLLVELKNLAEKTGIE